MISARYAYVIFLSVKQHFSPSSKYSLATYGYITKLKDSFDSRRDKHFFKIAAKKYPDEKEFKEYVISSFLKKDVKWIGDIVMDENSRSIYLSRMGRVKNLEKTFEKESSIICEQVVKNGISGINEAFVNLAFELLQNEDISLETFIILNNIFPKKFKENLDNSLVFEYTYKDKLNAYKSLFVMDSVYKYKRVFDKTFKKEYENWSKEKSVNTVE